MIIFVIYLTNMLTHSLILNLNIFRIYLKLIMAKTITTIYFNGQEEDMKLHSPSLRLKWRIRRLDRTLSEFKCLYLKPSLCDCAKINRSFRNLAYCLGIDIDDYQKILKQISNPENKTGNREREKEQEVKVINAQQ